MGIPRTGLLAATLTIAAAAALIESRVDARAGGTSTSGAGQSAGGGSIRGRVGTPGAAPSGALKVTVDEKICGSSVPNEEVAADSAGGIAYAVITVKGLAWTGAPVTPRVTNKGCRFVPHVSVARPGSTLEITNEDPTLHTTHGYSADKRSLFNIALPIPGIVVKRPLALGVSRFACDTHPWMRAFVAVTADRSVVTGADGSFRVADVPPGSYEVTVWHETLQASSQKVTVAAGQPAELNFTLARR